MRKDRLGAALPDAPAIVGTWSYQHDAGARVFEKYSADSRFSLRLPFQARQDRYEVSGDVLTLEWEGAPPENNAFRIEGGELQLTPEGEEVRRYGRQGDAAWYRIPDAGSG